MFSLVQAERELYNKLVFSLKDCSFWGISFDPCLWIKHLNICIVMVPVYVDDCLVVGTEKAIHKMIECLKKSGFGLKVDYYLTDYLSNRINIEQATIAKFVMQS
jgi:hypothetical protein